MALIQTLPSEDNSHRRAVTRDGIDYFDKDGRLCWRETFESFTNSRICAAIQNDVRHGVEQTTCNGRVLQEKIFADGKLRNEKFFNPETGLQNNEIIISDKYPGSYERIDSSDPTRIIHYTSLTSGSDGGSEEQVVARARRIYNINGSLRAILPCFAMAPQKIQHSFNELYFHHNGKLAADIPYAAGTAVSFTNQKLFDADVSAWDADDPDFINPYPLGERHGEALFYHENGALKKTEPWVSGKIEGLVEEFDEDGRHRRTTPYKDGVRHGVETLFDDEGMPMAETRWEHGEEIIKTMITDKHPRYRNAKLWNNFHSIIEKISWRTQPAQKMQQDNAAEICRAPSLAAPPVINPSALLRCS